MIVRDTRFSDRATLDEAPLEPRLSDLEQNIARATQALLGEQRPDGHFVFELEADVSISAEYIIFKHYFGELPEASLAQKIGRYIRREQAAHGGWPLFKGGPFNVSSSVKAYFALKCLGDAPDAPHMARARAAILAHGGAAAANVFTRALLALFGALPWRGVPVMPIEIMHLPQWFPFHMTKVSYWARTVLVPLMVVNSLKPKARNPLGVTVSELFVVPPDRVRHWPAGPRRSFPWTALFGGIDKILQKVESFFPKRSRKSAIAKAVAFVDEHLNGEDGLGAIYPAMAYSAMMYDVLGYPRNHPPLLIVMKAIDRLLVIKEDEAYLQPCVSPVWDTSLACHALMEADTEDTASKVHAGLAWLKPLQVLDVKGDWAAQKPNLRPGGWAFQYANPHYPDLDDTAVVVLAMDRARGRLPNPKEYDQPIERAREWVEGMVSRNGGWGAFDADNDHEYLNNIPFADHGALLDPPTADVSARCLSMLSQLGETPDRNKTAARAVDYLLNSQEKDGSWYGRWGMNYIYGTWSVLCALNAAKVEPQHAAVRKAVTWLKAIQNEDGGWGEGGDSYEFEYAGYRASPSTSSQTAWALLGLMAAGEVDDSAVARGVAYLARTQGGDGFWQEQLFTATGFPRVFYLRYHGYAKFFPLWALARFRNLKRANHRSVLVGM
jgi:squalene-hopene/tetraprenyl-beta-curcumene cyclase